MAREGYTPLLGLGLLPTIRSESSSAESNAPRPASDGSLPSPWKLPEADTIDPLLDLWPGTKKNEKFRVKKLIEASSECKFSLFYSFIYALNAKYKILKKKKRSCD